MSTPATARWEPTPRWERRYHQVLNTAAAVFAEKGYAGASTRDIAERLGVRQASLYYYFPSKESALGAICELGVKDFIANLQAIIARKAPAARKFREAIAAGELRADLDPKLAALALLGLCNSVITNRGVPRSATVDAMIEEYTRIVIGGVVASGVRPARRSSPGNTPAGSTRACPGRTRSISATGHRSRSCG